MSVMIVSGVMSRERQATASSAGSPERARTIGLASNGLAIVGFLNGLTMTVRGGDLPDIAYHVVILPALIASVVALARGRAH